MAGEVFWDLSSRIDLFSVKLYEHKRAQQNSLENRSSVICTHNIAIAGYDICETCRRSPSNLNCNVSLGIL